MRLLERLSVRPLVKAQSSGFKISIVYINLQEYHCWWLSNQLNVNAELHLMITTP